MIKSFCVGAFVGFLFGSSKFGIDARNQLNGFIADFQKPDKSDEGEEKDNETLEYKFERKTTNGSKPREKVARGESAPAMPETKERADQPKKNDRAAAVADVAERPAKPKKKKNEEASLPNESERAAKRDATISGEKGLTENKAHELADKLSAKPSPPPHEELEPS